jgi:hypothetical protein
MADSTMLAILLAAQIRPAPGHRSGTNSRPVYSPQAALASEPALGTYVRLDRSEGRRGHSYLACCFRLRARIVLHVSFSLCTARSPCFHIDYTVELT